MRRLFLFVMFLFVLAVAGVRAEAFRYSGYDVSLFVRKDNSYRVEERMDVFFTEPRHGIVRDFQRDAYVKRRLPDGQGGVVERVMCYATEYGNFWADEPFEVVTEDGLGLRLGSADTLVEGQRNYTIGYDYEVGDDRTPLGDLFYYSLLGAYNDTEVDTFSFAIRFEKPVPRASLKDIRMYYGNLGDETVRNGCLTLVTDTLITGVVRGLSPNQAVTIYMPLPEGYFECEKSESGNAWLVWLGLSVVLIFVVLFRETKPRNRYTRTFDCWPPEGLSSADIGYIYDTTVDDQDIVSLIPYFAHKGWLAIDMTSGHVVLKKKADIPETVPAYQRTLFEAFFGNSDEFDTEKPDKAFAEKWLKVADGIKKCNKNIGDNFSWHAVTWLLSGICFLISLEMSDITDNSSVLLYGFCAVGVMLLIGATSLGFWDWTREYKMKRMLLVAFWAVCVLILYVVCGVAALQDAEVYLLPVHVKAYAAALCLHLTASVALFRLSYMTKERLLHIGQILGFKDFVEKSEKPLLDSLLKEHEHYFYDILPYAVAFGLSEKWIKRFEGLLTVRPEWFESQEWNTTQLLYAMNHRHLYTSAMRHKVAETRVAQMEASSKSSASSGSYSGFSGGGFGGGGSHSW